jgi:serine/threonine-protein kinase
MSIKALAFATVALASLLPVTAASAEDWFGAVAYSDSTSVPGTSKNYKSTDEAKQAAMESCKENGGADDCRIVLEYKNACAAIAAGTGGWGTATNEVKETADSMTLEECGKYAKDCKILTSLCSGDY